MKLSKTTEEEQEVLLVDRTDEGTPEATQSFTKAQLLDIQANTLAHKEALEEAKESRADEYAYYFTPGEDGKTIIDRSLEEIDALLAKCTELNITE